jgi:hypothetical protein
MRLPAGLIRSSPPSGVVRRHDQFGPVSFVFLQSLLLNTILQLEVQNEGNLSLQSTYEYTFSHCSPFPLCTTPSQQFDHPQRVTFVLHEALVIVGSSTPTCHPHTKHWICGVTFTQLV